MNQWNNAYGFGSLPFDARFGGLSPPPIRKEEENVEESTNKRLGLEKLPQQTELTLRQTASPNDCNRNVLTLRNDATMITTEWTKALATKARSQELKSSQQYLHKQSQHD